MKHKLILKVLLICSCTILFSIEAKSQIWLDDEAIYEEAEEYLSGEDFEEALPLYQLLEKKGIINSNISYKIGVCYYNIFGKNNQSIPYLEAASENVSQDYTGTFAEKDAPLRAFLLLGIAYRINYQFDKAMVCFQQYKKLATGTEFEQLADSEIKLCKNAKAMTDQPYGSKTDLIADSSEFSLYNPISMSVGKICFMEKRKFYDAVIQANINNRTISDPVNITPLIGSDGDYTISSISADGNTMILTAYQAGNGSELYFSVSREGMWGKVQKYPEPVNSPFNETGGSLSADGNTFYFCSNRAGGEGGTDIYKSTKQADGSWGNPLNLGKRINSRYNEDAVYITSDGNKLFFASEGHMNMGGFDLFVTVPAENGEFSYPVNLGSPVSTPDNDKFISPIDKGEQAYIYKFDIQKSDRYQIYKVVFDENMTVPKLLVRGKLEFSDSIHSKSVEYNVTDDKTSQIIHKSTTPEDGTYNVILPTGNYKINFVYSEDIQATQTIFVDPESSIDELSLESPIWRTRSIETPESPAIIYVHDILFAFDSYSVNPKYFTALDSIVQVLSRFGAITVVVTGHSDAMGDTVYNQMLSEKRADAVKDYLVSKNISGDRITAAGKGVNGSVAVNRNPNGSDNPKGRMYNRRVFIEINKQNENLKILSPDTIPAELKVK